MSEFNQRELDLIKETTKAVMKEAGHICHFPEDKRKELHSLTDEGHDRVKHLVEIADAAHLVGIESDGHIVMFSIGKQVTVIGQKAVSAIIITILVATAIAIILAFGWKPLSALLLKP